MLKHLTFSSSYRCKSARYSSQKLIFFRFPVPSSDDDLGTVKTKLCLVRCIRKLLISFIKERTLPIVKDDDKDLGSVKGKRRDPR